MRTHIFKKQAAASSSRNSSKKENAPPHRNRDDRLTEHERWVLLSTLMNERLPNAWKRKRGLVGWKISQMLMPGKYAVMFTLLGLCCSCSTHALLGLLMLYCERVLTCRVSDRRHREISLVTHSLVTQENLSFSQDVSGELSSGTARQDWTQADDSSVSQGHLSEDQERLSEKQEKKEHHSVVDKIAERSSCVWRME